jgi:hypothetical protein
LASDGVTTTDKIDRSKAVDVAALSKQMREMAAATLLVLDTAFPDNSAR